MSIGKKISNIVITILFLLVAVCIFTIVILRITTFHITGHSMNPTLVENELVIAIPRDTYNRGDIIAFDTEGTTAIKRVIGTPGDKVFIDEDGTVYVNDKKITEDYITTKNKGDIETSNPCTVPSNEYYVLGDNRSDSKDSRYIKVGTVKKENIKAKIYYSISKVKKIK